MALDGSLDVDVGGLFIGVLPNENSKMGGTLEKNSSTMPVRYLTSDVCMAEQGRGNTERRRLDMHVYYAVTSPGFHLAPAPSMT